MTSCPSRSTGRFGSLIAVTSLLFSYGLIEAAHSAKELSLEGSIARKVRVVYSKSAVQTGRIIDSDSLTWRFIDRSKCPTNSIHDVFIAAGRKAQRPLTADRPVLLEDCFSQDRLRTVEAIQRSQENTSLAGIYIADSQNQRISVFRCRNDMRAGAKVDIRDLVVEQIEQLKCPAQAVGDRLIIMDRAILHPLKKGTLLEFRDVIPDWNRIFYGKDLAK